MHYLDRQEHGDILIYLCGQAVASRINRKIKLLSDNESQDIIRLHMAEQFS
jgi:hypothetical protein